MFFDIDVLFLHGVHIHQITWFGRGKAKMEFNTFKSDPKSSKRFPKKKNVHVLPGDNGCRSNAPF